MNKERKYHYFYKITNLINNHFYYGVHNTDNLNDGYMGSGKRLHIAYQKYGIESFKKEILKYFNTAKQAFEYEAEIITEELVKDDNCYNIQEGGKGLHSINTIMVKNIYTNETFRCHKDDPRLQTGELVGITKGMLVAEDNNGNRYYISKDDPRYLSGELHSVMKGKCNNKNPQNLKNKIIVKDKNYKYFIVDNNDKRYLSGELIPISKNRKFVYDNNGKRYFVELNDPRLLSGELHIRTKTKNKTNKHYQQGEKNSQYGTCWIYNDELQINKKIKKEELNTWLKNGWNKGSKLKYCNKFKNQK